MQTRTLILCSCICLNSVLVDTIVEWCCCRFIAAFAEGNIMVSKTRPNDC